MAEECKQGVSEFAVETTTATFVVSEAVFVVFAGEIMVPVVTVLVFGAAGTGGSSCRAGDAGSWDMATGTGLAARCPCVLLVGRVGVMRWW
ncbi:hypothetical protein [Streptomyces sp. SAS_260]|uniref:hypothetical protein n=1 Tax=Streptomyces sp. SAS_260 TaxID=3412751 RepID=UPI00403D161B